ncbi:rhomboid-like protein [Streptomyces sp. NPDC057445]|uniref:rhomboid-like protein n=1 Tax=Streptomyces sp. NPDC057445 TaxID=3346136 RepID=UPI003689D5C2
MVQRLEPRELLGGIPRQRPTQHGRTAPAREDRGAPAPAPVPAPAPAPAESPAPESRSVSAKVRARGVGRLLPTPVGTPFTFWYAVVLLATSLYTDYGDPATVSALLRGSSTDVAHLATTPLLVLVASALWVAGGLASAYAVGFVFVLTALERRIGGWRAAAVFLGGHVAATLATELPVGLSVMAGHLPGTSLQRLDYGISFGLLTCVGALAGLLGPMARSVVLGWVSVVLLGDLLTYEDPLSNWGHPLALLAGIAAWPVVRRWARDRAVARRAHSGFAS